mmetsp:Transcript_103903/g.237869  ORF Transcript_103903/g.237869 Transcript_103903/m.237869 type:complete len:216 (-) Transcript_103903:219-866(-)
MMMQRQFAPRRSVELLTGLTEEEAAIFGNLVQQIKKEQDVHRLTRIAVLSALAELPSHHLEAVVEKALSARPKPVSDNEDSYLGAPPGLPQPCSLCSHCDPEDSQKCVVIVKRLAKADNIHTVRDLLDSRGFAGQYTYLFAPVNLVGTPPKFRTLGFANVGFVSHTLLVRFSDRSRMIMRRVCRSCGRAFKTLMSTPDSFRRALRRNSLRGHCTT